MSYLWTNHALILIVMLVLMLFSAFFSASESAFFSLTVSDRQKLKLSGGYLGQKVLQLLEKPEQLLTALLWWNLIVNLIFFVLSSIISVDLQRNERHTESGLFAIFSLFGLIIFCEMLPKDVAVLFSGAVAKGAVLPVSLAIRTVSPIFPILKRLNLLSQRLFFPKFQKESPLEKADLEKILQSSSTNDAVLSQQERLLLRQVLDLSDVRVEKLMHPRVELNIFHRLPTGVEFLELIRTKPLSGNVFLFSKYAFILPENISENQRENRPENILENHVEKSISSMCFDSQCPRLTGGVDVFDSASAEDLDEIALAVPLNRIFAGEQTVQEIVQYSNQSSQNSQKSQKNQNGQNIQKKQNSQNNAFLWEKEFLRNGGQTPFYLPWSVSVSQAVQEMSQKKKDVAFIVNEYGENLGMVVFSELLDFLFQNRMSVL